MLATSGRFGGGGTASNELMWVNKIRTKAHTAILPCSPVLTQVSLSDSQRWSSEVEECAIFVQFVTV